MIILHKQESSFNHDLLLIKETLTIQDNCPVYAVLSQFVAS